SDQGMLREGPRSRPHADARLPQAVRPAGAGVSATRHSKPTGCGPWVDTRCHDEQTTHADRKAANGSRGQEGVSQASMLLFSPAALSEAASPSKTQNQSEAPSAAPPSFSPKSKSASASARTVLVSSLTPLLAPEPVRSLASRSA